MSNIGNTENICAICGICERLKYLQDLRNPHDINQFSV